MVDRCVYHYSEAFKLQVVGELERDHRSFEEVRRKYGIGGGATLQKWVVRYGKSHLLSKVVRVEKPEERDRVRELEKKIRQLESALAQERVKTLAYESLMEVAQEQYGVDFKKNSGPKPLNEVTDDKDLRVNV